MTIENGLHEKLSSGSSNSPQRQGLIDAAMEMVKRGMADLEALGHQLHLTWAEPTPPVEYPKMMYHDDHPAEQVADAAGERALLLAGWRDHPSKDGPQAVIEAEPEPIPAAPTVTMPQPSDHPLAGTLAPGGLGAGTTTTGDQFSNEGASA